MNMFQNVAGNLITIFLVFIAAGFLVSRAWMMAKILLGVPLFKPGFGNGRWFLWKYAAEFVPGGLLGLDPAAVYEKIFVVGKNRQGQHHLGLRALGEKKRYWVLTARAPSKYFKVTGDGGWIPYLYVAPKRKGSREGGPAKIYRIFRQNGK